MSGGIKELVVKCESSPAVAEAHANIARLQAESRKAKEALGRLDFLKRVFVT